MKLNVDKKKVEVLLDDQDMHNLLSGKQVIQPELGANDQRPLIVGRWKNPVLKLSNKDHDHKAIALLTGEHPHDKIVRERPGVVAKTVELPRPEPFSVKGEDATKELGQASTKPQAGGPFGTKVPGQSASRFRVRSDDEGGHQDKDVPH